MNVFFKSLAAASLMLTIFGCDSVSTSRVDIVKNSKLQPGSSFTTGKAFDASFGTPTWTEEETAKGRKVVKFQGNVDKPFLDMLTDVILDEGVTSLVTLSNCVDSDFAGEMIGNTITAGLTSLFTLGKVDAGKAIAEPVSKRLQEKDLQLTVSFDFADETNFRIGYYGFKSDDWKDCELMKIVDQNKFMDFVFSDHEYVKTEQLPKTEKKKVKEEINVTLDVTNDSTATPADTNSVDSTKADTTKVPAPAPKTAKKVVAKEKVAPVEKIAPIPAEQGAPAEKKSKKRR